MRHLFRLIRALFKLGFRGFYSAVVLSANAKIPKLGLGESIHGIFSGLDNDHLFNLAISKGTNEPHFTALAKLLIKPSDTVLDIGSNMGTHSVALSKLVPKGRVFAFEPQSLMFSILQNNLLLNQCENVQALKFAISDQSHKVICMEPFNFSGNRTNNGALRVSLSESLGDFCVTRTLDSFDFDKVCFLKLDCQGSEFRALKGGGRLIRESRPYIFIEMEEQHLKALESSTQELMEKLFSFSYGIYRIETEYPCDHICVPLEKVDHFEAQIAANYSYPISKMIYGERACVYFKNANDQNYLKVETFS